LNYGGFEIALTGEGITDWGAGCKSHISGKFANFW